MSQIILVTGCSSGLGEGFTKQLLASGNKVIATARDVSKLTELEKAGAATLALDVTWAPEQLAQTMKKAISIYGHIDVLINNAGYVETAIMEEMSPESLQKQFSTNVFGAVAVTNAVLPHMRSRKAGVVAFIGSIAAWGPFTTCGAYCASKAALAMVALTYEQELQPFGVKTLLIEPGFTRTVFLRPGNRQTGEGSISDYDQMRAETIAFFDSMNGKQPGDPEKVVSVTIDLIKKLGSGEKNVPTRLALGSDALLYVKDPCLDMVKRFEDHHDLICSTDIKEAA